MCSAVDTPAGRPGPRSRLCERLLELDHTAEHTSSGPGRMPAAPRRHGRLRLVELELAADGGCGSGRGWGEGAVGSSRQRPREQWSWEAHRGRGRPIAWRAHTETRGERITRRRPTISIGLGGGALAVRPQDDPSVCLALGEDRNAAVGASSLVPIDVPEVSKDVNPGLLKL